MERDEKPESGGDGFEVEFFEVGVAELGGGEDAGEFAVAHDAAAGGALLRAEDVVCGHEDATSRSRSLRRSWPNPWLALGSRPQVGLSGSSADSPASAPLMVDYTMMQCGKALN